MREGSSGDQPGKPSIEATIYLIDWLATKLGRELEEVQGLQPLVDARLRGKHDRALNDVTLDAQPSQRPSSVTGLQARLVELPTFEHGAFHS